jgi:hypothetical protein
MQAPLRGSPKPGTLGPDSLFLHFEETGSHRLTATLVTIGAILDFPTVSSPFIQIFGELLIETDLIGAKGFK